MKRTLELWNQIIEPGCESPENKLAELANLLWDEGHSEEAVAVQQELRDRFKEAGDSFEWVAASWLLASQLKAIDLPDEAIAIIDETYPVAVDLLDSQTSGFLAYLKAQILSSAEHYLDAIEACNNASKDFGGDDNDEMLGETNFIAALCLMAVGYSDKAVEAFEVSIHAFERNSNPQRSAKVRVELSDYLASLRRLDSARVEASQSLAIARFLNCQELEQKALHILGCVHAQLGDEENSKNLLERAVSFKANTTQLKESARAMHSIAQHSEFFGHAQKALAQFSEVKPIFMSVGIEDEFEYRWN